MGSIDLGIIGNQFTINSNSSFLLGISYYAGLGASKEFILSDLDKIQSYGFNWIRVWATWAAFGNDVSVVDKEGSPREPFLSKLKWLLEECDRRRIIVDVTLSRGNGVTGPKRLQSLEYHLKAVCVIVESLKEYNNWYLDLANERNIKDERFVSMEDLKVLRDKVKNLYPHRLVTASYAGDLSYEEMLNYLNIVQVDFLAIHRPRNSESPRQTAEWTKRYLKWMEEIGHIVPIHYQEPFRRGFNKDWEPTANDFLIDLKQAMESDAAGWCFHNGDQRNNPDGNPRRSFDLSTKTLFEQLDNEEYLFLNQLLTITKK